MNPRRLFANASETLGDFADRFTPKVSGPLTINMAVAPPIRLLFTSCNYHPPTTALLEHTQTQIEPH